MPKRTPGYGVWASGYAATAGGRGGRKARSGGAVRLDTASGGTAPDGPDAARHRGLTGYIIRTARCHCDAQAASAWPQRIRPRTADRAAAPEPAHERRLTPDDSGTSRQAGGKARFIGGSEVGPAAPYRRGLTDFSVRTARRYHGARGAASVGGVGGRRGRLIDGNPDRQRYSTTPDRAYRIPTNYGRRSPKERPWRSGGDRLGETQGSPRRPNRSPRPPSSGETLCGSMELAPERPCASPVRPRIPATRRK